MTPIDYASIKDEFKKVELIFNYCSQAEDTELLVESTMRNIQVLYLQPELYNFISEFASDSTEANNRCPITIELQIHDLP